MRVRHSTWTRAVVGVVALAVVAVTLPAVVQASNMGFKMNRQICGDNVGANNGRNLVALPFRNPYQNASDACTALNLTPSATGFNILQVRAQTGQSVTYRCGDLNPFQFQAPPGNPGQGLELNGLVVFNGSTANTNGILVGSHQPGRQVTLWARGGTATAGDNYFPVLYHSTAVNAQDLCVDLGLVQSGITTVLTRINACTGAVQTHFCGDLNAFPLVLGEPVKIEFNTPTNPNPLNVAAGHPAHF